MPLPKDSSTHPRPSRRWLALLALCIGLALSTFFGLRACKQFEYAQRVDRGEIQVETLRGWMTLPYIERVYGVPEADQRAALDLPATGFEDRSLRAWFEAEGIEPAAGRRRIEALILQRGPGIQPAKVDGAVR